MSIVSLKINVVSVSHLPKTDFGFWASCDGFVCLELGTAKAQTTHVKNTYDPKFHQHFSFTLENGDAGQMLKVIVMDADILTNEEIGRTEIEVSKTLAAGFVTLNIKDDTGNTVIGKSGQPTEVLLHLEVVEMEAVATAGQRAMAILQDRAARRTDASEAEGALVGPLVPLPPPMRKQQFRSQMNHPTVELPFERARRMRNLAPAADSPAEGAMWMDKAFVGEFGDAFVQDTSLEGGHIGPAINTFARISNFVLEEFGATALTLFSEQDRTHVKYVLDKLKGAEAVENELHIVRRDNAKGEGPEFPKFLSARAKQVKDLAVGEFLIWPGGWLGESGGHAIMHIIDKTSESTVSFITCNTGQGVGYHPADGTGYPKSKRRTAFRVDNVPLERIADPALLYMFWKLQLYGSEDHRPAVVYEVVIPHLVGSTLRVAAEKAKDDPFAVQETLQRSGVCYYRCILCATRYSLRRRGLTQKHVKQLLHVVRRGYVVMVDKDLEQCKQSCEREASEDAPDLPGLFPSDLRLILLSCQQLAYSAVKESNSGRMSLDQLKALSIFVGEVKTKAVALPLLGMDVDLRDPSAPDAIPQLPCSVGGLQTIRETAQETCDAWAGEETAAPVEPCVNQLAVPRSVDALASGADGSVLVLEKLREVCGQLRKSSKVGSAMLQVASQIEFVFVEVLPPPVHDGECRWRPDTAQTRSKLLELLQWCSEEFTAVCRSVPTSEEMHTSRVLTHTLILSAYYQTVRTVTPDAEPLDKVLPDMIQDERLVLCMETPGRENLTSLLSERCLLRPALAEAYSLVAKFLADVHDWGRGGKGALYDFAVGKDGKITLDKDAAVFELVSRFNGRYSNAGADQFGPGQLAPNIGQFITGRDKKEDANELQRKCAWLLLGSKEGSDEFGPSCAHLHALRTLVFRFKLGVQYARPGTGGGSRTFANGPLDLKCSFNKEKTQAELLATCCGAQITTELHPFSPANPLCYQLKTARREVTEDDVLFKEILDNFDDSLSQEDSEVLFSLLTAPYVRMPLVLEFFAHDRVGILLNEKLQELLRAVIFDAGPWTRADEMEDIDFIPAPREKLATFRGALMAELERAPASVLKPLLKLIQEAVRLSTGDYRSAFVDVLCYVTRIASRMQCYVRFVRSKQRGDDTMLAEFDEALSACLRGSALKLLERWTVQAAKSGDKALQSALHAHVAVTHWPVSEGTIDVDSAASFLSSTCFVMTWHLPGVGAAESNEEDKAKQAQEKLEAAAALSKRGGLGGLCEQELFWLLASKRHVLNAWLCSAPQADAQKALSTTLQLVVENDGVAWALLGNGVGELQDGVLVECVDANGEYRLNVQNCNLSFKQSGLKPVPETIARHYEFQQFFSLEVPFCAEVSRNANRHSVKVLSKNMLVESWTALHRDMFALIPGAPKIDPPPRMQVFESTHPYPSNDSQSGTVTLEGAKGLSISFDPQCRTEKGYDKLKLKLPTDEPGKTKDVEVSGNPSAWAGGFQVNGDTFSYEWKSDSGNNGEWNDSWGWRMTVTEKFDLTSGTAKVQYGGVSFGGPGRVYRYEEDMPADVAWVAEILDPVLHGALTVVPKNGRGPPKWKEVGRNGTPAVDLAYLLPADPLPPDACSCTLLSQDDNTGYWREVRVWRGLHCVDVMVVDAFGRRAFPRQVYTSDSRFTLASTEFKSPEEPALYPPPTPVRYQSGNLLTGPIGSRNVLLTDVSNADRPMLRITENFLQGVIPGAMVDNFTFWQDLSSGSLHGRKVEKERRNAAGKPEKFTDPWFDYELEVKIGGAENTRIIRVEEENRSRCLVNLKAVARNSPECDIVRLVTRLDHLSHVLAWTKSGSKAEVEQLAEDKNVQIELIELPRLRVRFAVKRVGFDGRLQLFSLDRTGYHVLEDQSQLPPHLLQGLSNSLLLSDAVGTLAIMVCNYPLVRPTIAFCPFSVATYPQPCTPEWQQRCEMRTFVYELHVSNEMVLFPSLGSTLYWAYSKLLHRQYAAAFLAIQSCCTDMELDGAESTYLGMFGQTLEDHSPDAHACRLKLRLALMYCPIKPDDWPIGGLEGLLEDFASYVDKVCHVAAACRLSAEEEQQLAQHLLEHCESAKTHPTVINRNAYLTAVARAKDEGKEPEEVTVPIIVSKQADGGRQWASTLSKSLESVKGYTDGNHWFGNCTFEGTRSTYTDGEVIQACQTALADDMAGGKGFGYCFYSGLFGGHTRMSIASEDVTKSMATLLVKLVLLKTCKWGQGQVPDGVKQPFHLLVASTCSDQPISSIPKLPKLSMAPTYKSSQGGNTMELYNAMIGHAKALAAGDTSGAQWEASPGDPERGDCVVKRDARREQAVFVSDYKLSQRTLSPFESAGSSLSDTEAAAFAAQPLQSLIALDQFTAPQPVASQCPPTPPFDLSEHPDAKSKHAKDTLDRIREDWSKYAALVNGGEEVSLCGITPERLKAYEDGEEPPPSAPSYHGPIERERPIGEIGGVMEVDGSGIPIIRDQTPDAGGSGGSFFAASLPKLRELKDRLVEAHDNETTALRDATRSVVVRANACEASADTDGPRIGFELMRFCTLEPVVSAEFLVASLVSSKGAEDVKRMNPFLSDAEVESILNAVTAVVFKANRIAQLRRAIGGTNDVIRAIETKVDGRKLRKEVEGLVGNLCGKRHFFEEGKPAFDPRFLLFEYLFGWLLSKAQVYLVQTFMERLIKGGKNEHEIDTKSMVHQMIMGSGKTTCIGPLLALMLSDGTSLVTQVVPNALLAMSRNVMWGRFTQVLTKPVYTLVFSRGQAADEKTFLGLYEKMDRARRRGGIVVTTPSAIKSMVNKYCELLYSVKEAPARLVENTDANKKEKRSQELELKIKAADALARVMDLWSDRRSGVLLLDEVDMLLHPLRSELNFPIGEKFPITPAPIRWELPMHILDAVFYAGGRAWPPGRSVPPKTLVDLRAAVEAGIQQKLMQNTPHLVLLDPDHYDKDMMPLVADWALSWMRSHHVFDKITLEQSKLEEYIRKGQNAAEETLNDLRTLSSETIQILNLAHDWVTSYVPHALAKVNRVSFGLLHEQDLITIGREQPASRLALAVPFMGKDVPSPAAEFAQPDVLIAMTIVAYNYEGLRQSDVRGVIRQLKQQLHFQAGPVKDRPANRTFEDWVESACKQKRVERNVLTLELTQLGDEREMDKIFHLLKDSQSVISYHLLNMAFPQTMHQQKQKISASGQELGSDILFGRRAGFSGTPSNLLPTHLTPCKFEEGSEGKILRTLTDEHVTLESPLGRALDAEGSQWTVQGVLDQIATADPPYNALIDTGALITGYSNEEVARYLIENGLKTFRGCIYLDENDDKQIYLRGAIKAVPLSECGLSVNQMFTFFDQVHTTGMDIKQALSACAVLTIGKDMTFRDYAQGAYRMRGIGKGQTIHLFVIPEVKLLIKKTLDAKFSGNLVQDVAAWLLLNGLRMEKLQFLQLCTQNLQTVWRQRALENLLTASGVEGIPDVNTTCAPRDVRGGLARFHGDGAEAKILRDSVQCMVDTVDFDVPNEIPTAENFVETLKKQCDLKMDKTANPTQLVTTKAQLDTKVIVLKQASDATSTSPSEEAQTKLGSEMTREKEREQEQQKQKQQQQQSEMQFAPNEGEQTPWPASLLFESPTATTQNNFPLYPLSAFSPRPKDFSWQNTSGTTVTVSRVSPLAFPATVLQTNNFAPLDRDLTAPLRLKNVTLVVDWVPDVSSPTERVSLVVTLSEAEAIRGLIHRNRTGMGQGAMALLSVAHNSVLDATEQYAPPPDTEGPMVTSSGACLRFWNGDMFLTEAETQLLLSGLDKTNTEDRRQFFEAAIAARRRSKKVWADAPVRKAFLFDDNEELIAMIALTSRIQEAINNKGYDLVKLCEAMDRDGDGFLSTPEIQRVLQHLEPTIDLPDLQRLVALMDEDGDNAIEYHEFERMFAGGYSSAEDSVTSLMKQRPQAAGGFQSLFSGAGGTKSSLNSNAKRDKAAEKRQARERQEAERERQQAEKEEERRKEEQKRVEAEEEERKRVLMEEQERVLMEEQERIQRQKEEAEQDDVDPAGPEPTPQIAGGGVPECSSGHQMTQKVVVSGPWQCCVCRETKRMDRPLWKCGECEDCLCKGCAPKTTK